MRCLLVLLATATARKNETSKLVLFWHFHKAGGTSFCRMLKEAKLREGGYNCGCNFRRTVEGRRGVSENPLRIGAQRSAFAIAEDMARRGADVCMVERGSEFPTADELRGFSADWRGLGGALVAVFRDPWQRFTSTFLRDYGELFLHAFSEKEFRNNGYGAADVAAQKRTATIEDFASPTFNATPMGHHARVWGSINRPNFYVRHLVGVDDGDVVMTMRDLKAALATLAYFTHVFLLDGDIQRGVQHNLTGRDDVHIRKPQSNNPYSGANAAKRNKRLPAPPDVAHYNATFARENCLDAALVAEVRRRVARAGTCAGCAPAPPSSAPKDVCGPRRAWVQ